MGGWITDTFTWRWIFLINVPVGVISLYLTSRWVFDPPHFIKQRLDMIGRGFKIDSIGFALLALGFGSLQIVLDKGQQEDWFESNFIIAMTAISVVTLLILPWWEMRQRDPMMDVRLLLQRNFLISNILIFMLGFILFGSTVLLPMFVQTMMGYSATDAGMLLSPGGLAVLCFMPFIGMMINKVDVRHMIVFGIVSNALALFLMSQLNMQADFWSMAVLRILQGIGLGFLFIPINTAAFADIPPNKSSNASAIINLSRNLGGSFGISLVQTWLTQGAQRHQVDLASHVDATSLQARSMLDSLTATIHQQGAPLVDAAHQAQATVYAFVRQQAMLLSFLDNFRFLCFMFLAFIPLVYLMKRSAKHA